MKITVYGPKKLYLYLMSQALIFGHTVSLYIYAVFFLSGHPKLKFIRVF